MMNYTVKELRQLLDAKKISVKELLDGYFAEIEKKNPIYNAYIIVTKEQAYKQADYAQKLIDDGKAKALTGIPMAIKDNIMTKGILTTCASQMLKDYIPVFDATAIRKLYEEGAVIIGKTNLDEFGMGCQSKNSYFGKTLNPLNTDYIPGGSSGGPSAAAVAGGLAAAAWARIRAALYDSLRHAAVLWDSGPLTAECQGSGLPLTLLHLTKYPQ